MIKTVLAQLEAELTEKFSDEYKRLEEMDRGIRKATGELATERKRVQRMLDDLGKENDAYEAKMVALKEERAKFNVHMNAEREKLRVQTVAAKEAAEEAVATAEDAQDKMDALKRLRADISVREDELVSAEADYRERMQKLKSLVN